jgi:predicted RNA-binding Zn-ribbon protein involved in translation (DUF1610 family)
VSRSERLCRQAFSTRFASQFIYINRKKMRFFCNNCNQKIHASHYWEGMSVTCPSCGKSTELRYREGQKIPNTEYSISFRDFRHLLVDKTYSKALSPIIEKLLGCSVKRTEAGVELVAKDGSLIPLEVAHFEIQTNSNSQRVIYGAAMSQWR